MYLSHFHLRNYALRTKRCNRFYINKSAFLYGSKPSKEYRTEEFKEFGGIHGGHVSIEVDSINFGFGPYSKFHLIGKRNNRHRKWFAIPLEYWETDTAGDKFTTFVLPVSAEQHDTLKKLMVAYSRETPYDYAFIGMRCASATWDILSLAGILKKHSRMWMTWRCFYPKLIRNKFFRKQRIMNSTVSKQPGRQNRKWEKDKRKYRWFE